MCTEAQQSAVSVAVSAPRPACGPAVDPITLPEVAQVAVTVLVDNTYDALLAPSDGVSRTGMGSGLVDTGASPDALVVNAGRLGLDAGDWQAVVLSHGHPDHAGGFDGLARLRGRGLVVITGCGHAGVVNIVRQAMRLTGVSSLLAVIGGFHLSGPAFEPVIGPTVDALASLRPALLAPGHCTGWRAQHTLAAALPDAWVPSSVGTTYTLSEAA